MIAFKCLCVTLLDFYFIYLSKHVCFSSAEFMTFSWNGNVYYKFIIIIDVNKLIIINAVAGPRLAGLSAV